MGCIYNSVGRSEVLELQLIFVLIDENNASLYTVLGLFFQFCFFLGCFVYAQILGFLIIISGSFLSFRKNFWFFLLLMYIKVL